MKKLGLALALLLVGVAPMGAQTPARPADPTQARPADPVVIAPPATGMTNAVVTPGALLSASSPQVSVMADSSLRAVLQELAQTWADSLPSAPQVPITLTNAGTMRSKIESGEVCDVVLDADLDDVKALTDKGLVLADGQHSVARNTLVAYGRKALVKDDELEWFDLMSSEWKKVAFGDPLLVASGRVAQRALQKHDLLGDDRKDSYIHTPNEAGAIHVAEREQADAILVYRTDLVGVDIPGFEQVVMKTDDAPPVFYTVAIARLAKNPELARSFVDYISGDSAKPIWVKYGFETN